MLNIDLEIDQLLNEGYFSSMDTDIVSSILDEIVKDLEKTLKNDKKAIYVKNNVITIKGTNLINRCSSVKMSDNVEGMILRKYYDIKPPVHITVTYFKVGTKIYKNFYNRKKKTREIEGVNYTVGAGVAMTTSIKIKISPAKKFTVGRIVNFMNNQDSTLHYEKLSEETIC